MVVFPRLEKDNEHVDDHQLQIADAFEKQGYVAVCRDKDCLSGVIDHCLSMEQKPYVSQKEHFLAALKDAIDKPKANRRRHILKFPKRHKKN